MCAVLSVSDVGTAHAGTNVWTSHGPYCDQGGGSPSPNTVNAVVVDPQRPDTLYAGTFFCGMFKSTDGGGDWSAVNTGLVDSEGSPYSIDGLAVDSGTTPSTLYAGSKPGVFKSVDGGESWVNTGLAAHGVALVIDPHTPGTLYVGTGSFGVFKSTDSGHIWSAVNTGLPPEGSFEVDSLAIDPSAPGTLYVGTFDGVDASLFKSTSGGDSWRALTTGLSSPYVSALAIDTPTTPSALYVGFGGSLLKSTDGGDSWRALTTGLSGDAVEVNALAIDTSTTPSTVYAGICEGGVYKSTNGGDSWSALTTGLSGAALCVDALAIDTSTTPSRVYAGTDAGVFDIEQATSGTPTPTLTSTVPPSTPTPVPSTLTPGGPTPTIMRSVTVGTGAPADCTEAALDMALGCGAPNGSPPASNCNSGATVTFNCGGSATITITSTKIISADTIIDGGGVITISGGNNVGVFSVPTGVNFTVQNLTIANGYRASFGNGYLGGGIYSGGAVTVTNSTFSGNSAGGGGGIYIDVGPATVTNSTFSGNSATGVGGTGGGIFSGGPLTVTNSTFSGNSAGEFGGGIYIDVGPATVTNSTFSGNFAGGGGGIGGGAVTVTNTIVANSTSGGNCDGAVTDGGHNIDDDGTCGFTGTGCTSTSGTSFCNISPLLDPAGLANNGGPTLTLAIEPNSPAINAGDESVCSAPPVNDLDQRGYVRPAAGCSIGAYEYNAVPASPPPTPTPTPLRGSVLTGAITATDTCIPVSDTSIFSPTGGFALIGTELISYTGLSTSCSGTSAARASAGTAATVGVLTGVTRNFNLQGSAHAAGTMVTPTAAPCVGDCNGNGSVTVDEILTLVNIALGNAPVPTCEAGGANHDNEITIDEILTAVNNALNGCGGG